MYRYQRACMRCVQSSLYMCIGYDPAGLHKRFGVQQIVVCSAVLSRVHTRSATGLQGHPDCLSNEFDMQVPCRHSGVADSWFSPPVAIAAPANQWRHKCLTDHTRTS